MTSTATQDLIHALKAVGPLPRRKVRRGPLPAPQSTETIEREYANALTSAVVDVIEHEVEKVKGEILDDLARQREAAGLDDKPRGDAAPDRKKYWSHRLQPSSEWKLRSQALDARRPLHLLDTAAASINKAMPVSDLHRIAADFGERTSMHQQRQLDKQVRAAFGVDLNRVERPVTSHLMQWAGKNVDLIRTVPTRFFDRIRDDVVTAYEQGTHPSTLAKMFGERYANSQSDATRIARDQIGKLNGQLNRARQEAMGVKGYTWRTVGDNRVRECHEDLDGEACTWEDPPDGGGTDEDETGHPGDGIQCRCYAEPDFGDDDI